MTIQAKPGMKIFNLRTFNSLAVILALIFIDQFSKIFFINFLASKPNYEITITPFFSIVYAWNHGVSFGLFSQYQKYSNAIFFVINSLISCYLLRSYILDEKLHKFYLLIIGGAIGNVLDRVIHGAVFDFVLFHYGNYHFPVFNIADTWVTCGIAWFVIDTFFRKRDK